MKWFWLTRVGVMVSVTVCVVNGLWYIALPIFFVALLYYDAVEFLLLAWCIDVYFAPIMWTFWYTTVTFTALCVAYWCRPYLRVFILRTQK